MRWIINTPDDMRLHGERFANYCVKPCVIALIGDLGIGKTLWSSGFIRGLGSNQLVTSPTFSYMNEYHDTIKPVYHFDFYRINNYEKFLDLSWNDYLQSNAYILVEWADLFPELFDDKCHILKFGAEVGYRYIDHISIAKI